MHQTGFLSGAGSSGKSTTVGSLAVINATPQQPILVADGDSQADVSRSFGVTDPEYTTGDVLAGNVTLKEAIVETAYPGVFLLPARPDMTEQLVEWGRRRGSELRIQRLRDEIPDHWTVYWDCPGKITDDVTFAVVVGSDSVNATTYPRGKETKGIAQIEDLVAEVNSVYAWPVRLASVIVCDVPGASVDSESPQYLEAIRSAYGDLVAPTVRRSALVGKAYTVNQPVPFYSPSAHVTRDYKAVAAFLQRQGVSA